MSEKSETETRLACIDPVLNSLGYELTESVKQGLMRLEHKGRDYIVFPRGEANGAPLLVIEAKRQSIEIRLRGNFPDSSDRVTKEILDQSFRYAEDAGIPWILISNGRQWILMKTYIPGVNRDERVFLTLASENELKSRWSDLSSFVGLDQTQPITNRFRKLESQLSNKVMSFTLPEKTVDTIAATLKDVYRMFYEKARVTDHSILEKHASDLGISEKEFKHRACMRILHKLLFISITESFHIQSNILSPWGIRNYQRLGFKSPIIRLVNDVLADFNEKFDGHLFAENDEWDAYYWDDDSLRKAIVELDKIDYSMVDRDIIGDIYEHFLGEIVKEEENENIRKILGQYYTPSYVVDYIVKSTVEPYVRNYKGDLRRIRILDPACGSGSFLIKCYEVLRNAYKRKNDERRANSKKKGIENFLVEYDPINDPLRHNLFGVDVNPDAIQLAELNLNLQKVISDEYLRYVEPESIRKEDRLFPLANLKVANSLIDDANVAGASALNWKTSFQNVFDAPEQGFDIIIGNPPYVNVEHLTEKERGYLYAAYDDICVKRVDIFIPFIDRALSLLRFGGKLSYIVSYAFLSQDFGTKMRKKMLDSTLIEQIVDLRKFKIFPEAMVRNVIFRVTKLDDSEHPEKAHSNRIEVLMQTEDPKISRTIGKGVVGQTLQSTYLETPEYMFRTELDDENLDLIKRIKNQSLQIGEILCVSWGARGIPTEKFHLNNPIKGFEHLCRRMVKGENIDRYKLRYSGKWLLYDVQGEYSEKLYRPAFRELFENPKLIIAEVTGPKGLVATYDDQSFYTDHSLSCAIPKFRLEGRDKEFLGKHKIGISDDQIRLSREYDLRYLLGILNSSAINFYFRILLGYELNVYPELIEQLPVPIAGTGLQKGIIERVDTLLEISRGQTLIEDVFADLLAKFEFSDSKQLFHFYPNHPNEVKIDVVNSRSYDEPELLSKVLVSAAGDFVVLSDENNEPIHKILFSDRMMQQFFLMSIRKFLSETKKKNLNQVTKTIQIPVYSNNSAANAEKIASLMQTLSVWHQKAIQNELRKCPIKSLDLVEFEKMTDKIDNDLDREVVRLLHLNENDARIIERARDP